MSSPASSPAPWHGGSTPLLSSSPVTPSSSVGDSNGVVSLFFFFAFLSFLPFPSSPVTWLCLVRARSEPGRCYVPSTWEAPARIAAFLSEDGESESRLRRNGAERNCMLWPQWKSGYRLDMRHSWPGANVATSGFRSGHMPNPHLATIGFPGALGTARVWRPPATTNPLLAVPRSGHIGEMWPQFWPE